MCCVIYYNFRRTFVPYYVKRTCSSQNARVMAKRVALFAGSFSCRHNPSICATSLHHCGPLAASVTIYDPSRSQRKAISQPSYRSSSAAQSSVYNWPSGHETPTFKSSKRDFYYQI